MVDECPVAICTGFRYNRAGRTYGCRIFGQGSVSHRPHGGSCVIDQWTHRAQLDADHYGLEQIKRRLIEFLAVVRLHALADEPTPSNPIAADKASSDRFNPDRALVPAISRESSTAIEPPKALSTKRRKGVKGPILL